MGATYYPQLLETRILNDSRVDQSGSADGDVTGWNKTQKFIMATQIGYNNKNTDPSSYKMQFRDETDSPGGAFGDVGASGEIKYSASSASLVDETALTQANSRCTNQDASMTWQNGLENVGDNLLPDSGTFDLGDDYYSEFQWAFDPASAEAGHQYTFALYNITEGAAYECGAQITIEATASGYTYVAGGRGTDNGSGTTIDTSDTAFNVTAGDLLVVWVRWDGATTTCSVAETGGGNSFSMESVVANGSTICGVIGYRLSAEAASSVQFRATLGASRDYRSIFVMQFRPASGKSSSADAGPNPATGSGTAVESGQITTTGTDEVVVGGITDYDYWCNGSQQIGGVAADYILEGSLTTYFGSIFCRILTATASNITASGTQTNSVAWCCDIISIKATSAGVSIPIVMSANRRRIIP